MSNPKIMIMVAIACYVIAFADLINGNTGYFIIFWVLGTGWTVLFFRDKSKRRFRVYLDKWKKKLDMEMNSPFESYSRATDVVSEGAFSLELDGTGNSGFGVQSIKKIRGKEL